MGGESEQLLLGLSCLAPPPPTPTDSVFYRTLYNLSFGFLLGITVTTVTVVTRMDTPKSGIRSETGTE